MIGIGFLRVPKEVSVGNDHGNFYYAVNCVSSEALKK